MREVEEMGMSGPKQAKESHVKRTPENTTKAPGACGQRGPQVSQAEIGGNNSVHSALGLTQLQNWGK